MAFITVVDCLDIPCLLEKIHLREHLELARALMATLKNSSACRVCFLKLWLEEIGSDPCYRRAFGCLADGNVGGRYKNGPRGSYEGARIKWGVTSMHPTAFGEMLPSATHAIPFSETRSGNLK